LDEDSKSALLKQFLAQSGSIFRISDLISQFDAVFLNGSEWTSQLQNTSLDLSFR